MGDLLNLRCEDDEGHMCHGKPGQVYVESEMRGVVVGVTYLTVGWCGCVTNTGRTPG